MHIGQQKHELFQVLASNFEIVFQDVVLSQLSSSLNRMVTLQKEFLNVLTSNSPINNVSSLCIADTILINSEKTFAVTLGSNNKRDFWSFFGQIL